MMATTAMIAADKNLLPYDGLRGWIDRVAELGDLRIVEGAGTSKDIGQATELLQHHPDAPAVLFDAIPGHKKGFRILANMYGTPGRVALTFGLPADLDKSELSKRILDKVENSKPLSPRFV